MFTIKFQDNEKEFETTRSTIERAQSYARTWMDCWSKTKVFYTNCPNLVIFEATQFVVIKETL